jgi:hypothetical protein
VVGLGRVTYARKLRARARHRISYFTVEGHARKNAWDLGARTRIRVRARDRREIVGRRARERERGSARKKWSSNWRGGSF